MTDLFNYFDNFHKINAKDKLEIENISKTITIRKNDLLQQLGHTCKTIYFINQVLPEYFTTKTELILPKVSRLKIILLPE